MILDLPVPTQVLFGDGSLDRLGTSVRPHGRSALLVTGRTAARRTGVLQRARAALESAGVSVTHFDQVSANPRALEVDGAAALARDRGCDVVVGLGGGSALDAAKAVAVAAGLAGSVRDVIGTTLEPDVRVLPVIAVPTTSGSGSEVTKGAIITDTERGFRSGIRGEALFPKVAIVDPGLTASLPVEVLLDSVFDAFAHAVEGHVAVAATGDSRERSRRAIALITSRLPEAVQGTSSPELRRDLSLAALLGGVNVATVSTCLPHRLQQAMGSVPGLGISHGRGLALVYPSWLHHTEAAAPALFAEIAELLHAPSAKQGVRSLLAGAGLGTRFRDWGVARSELPRLVKGVSGNLGNDPAPLIDADYLHAICAEAY
ncbi:iron-containing alcohol dehydrogenase [Streptomyces polygonati]|uniref:Iron-containing alcohol dehydrogenase n=1 Tax=Streptomyces polygonati TaxID=1617087 RepID=A0ABV8HWR3_9ACTN